MAVVEIMAPLLFSVSLAKMYLTISVMYASIWQPELELGQICSKNEGSRDLHHCPYSYRMH